MGMAHNQASITIATPSLNSVGYIRRAIESVLCQDYAPLQYIIVDGGSTDGTRAIISEYSSRLTHYHARRGGAPNAINAAFEQGNGRLFAWLNADDSYLPGAVRSAATLL